MQPLNDRTALVVGGGTGIGRAIALALAQAGATVAVSGRRSEPLNEVAGRIANIGARAIPVPADARDSTARRSMVETVEREVGVIDVLVVSTVGPPPEQPTWLDWSDDDWRAEVEVGALAAFALSQLTVPRMVERRHGRIVLIGSIAGTLGIDPLLYRTDDEPHGMSAIPYHAAKGAMLATARALACEVGRSGVTVNVVSPGMIETEGVGSLLPAEVRERMTRLTPAGRLGTPEEVAAAVVFLAGPDAGFITGHELVVDGGWSAW